MTDPLLPPDPTATRRRNARVPKRLQGIWKYLVVPADAPTRFIEPLDQLAANLETGDVEHARTVLEDALAAHQEPTSRIESAESRATTLLGSVAIAASIAIAGGGLLLDPNKVPDQTWRVILAIGLVAFVLCLLGCAIRALGATSRIFVVQEPGIDEIPHRASMSLDKALTLRAAAVLRSFGVVDEIADIKVGLLRSATWWFRLALTTLGVLIVLIAACTISQNPSKAVSPATRNSAGATIRETQSTSAAPRTATQSKH
jgi:hypothetical protein